MTITSPLPYLVPLVLLLSQIRAVIAPSFLVLPPNVLHPQRLHPHPLLTRAELTSIFSNFIDIWNLHRSFYSSLTAFLNSSASAHPRDPPPPLSPVLLAHFPYLSLYTPFVSSFSDALASYAAFLRNNTTFASFIAQQEADPRCGKLKFRDWLLTIVQRCPRYLLLLKDMISCTDPEDPEYASLTAVHTLVSKSE